MWIVFEQQITVILTMEERPQKFSIAGNFKQWVFTQSKGFKRVGIEKVNLYDYSPI